MTHNPDRDAVGGLLEDLRDDGGRRLPATPEELLGRAKGIQRRRRTAVAAVTGVAALALMVGGVAFATAQFDQRIVTANQPTPSPTADRRAVPDRETVDRAESAVVEGLSEEYTVPGDEMPSSKIRDAFQRAMTPQGIEADYRTGEVVINHYDGEAITGELQAAADKALRDSGYFGQGVRLRMQPHEDTRAAQDAAYQELIRRTEQLQAQGLPAYVIAGDLVAVDGPKSNVEKVRKALADLGDAVTVHHQPGISNPEY